MKAVTEAVLKHCQSMVQNKAIFIVIACLEHSDSKEQIKKLVKKSGKLDDTKPGVKVL